MHLKELLPVSYTSTILFLGADLGTAEKTLGDVL